MITLPTLLAAARSRPLPASPPTPFAPAVWPSVAYARADATYTLNIACCAVLCARLRLLAAQMAASAPTPPQGFPVQQ